ncbi:MAG: NADH-quinone oxidoreductase subunit NuoH [Phycisphaeraceae bacterium]|nr:NADH-quinone oxidoreductase subunit NuoH [Phycisphaeraceae bacterium]
MFDHLFDLVSPQFVASVITIVVVIHAMLGATAYLIMLERKTAAWIQDRIGPNRVGPAGLLQPIADGIKFMLKEDYTPPHVDRRLFLLAPMLAVIPAMIGWAVVPWGGYLQWGEHVLNITAAPVNIGVVFILAVGSLAVYGVVLAGYASNNKYSFLGGLRATAQMLSYEIPMGLAVLIVILMHGTLRADYLVELQANNVWNIFYHPALGLIFFICLLAETNRAPFDLAEAEQELVGGYHTEYSSMKFALYFLGEYMHMITASAFFTLLFLGGWDLPLVNEPMVGGLGLVALKASVFSGKILALLFLMMWLRWSLPRFRFDQLMRLAWRGLIPATLVLLLAAGLLVFFKPADVSDTLWNFTHLGANILVVAALLGIAPMMPSAKVHNRPVGLAGSRFSPLTR